ncbi:helix-turn-helix transcriptional regulator [Corynebacterium freneyi]|uniref:helix-turn-helix domain-containing protein n=1 Tax=Corynebacterium freneyi TaxID=134034 RepID=UPI00254D45F3|nr:helix-turn-helix transcriptional regulator [Corynebacterium freneyi]MDK8768213.1 helix-turn-helix transcriptional regulator [Corynebacterium freneyi]
MESIDVVIGRRVADLRGERGWTQSQMRDLAQRFGVDWSQSTISEIESGKRRTDRLEVLAVLCSMFSLTLDELLAGDDEVMLGRPWTLEELREGLRGELEPASEKSGTMRLGGDNPVEVQRMAGKLGFTEEQLWWAVAAVYGRERRPIALRDEIAGVNQTDTSRSAQAKRGHATRRILKELNEAIDREGREELLERGSELAAKRSAEVISFLDGL